MRIELNQISKTYIEGGRPKTILDKVNAVFSSGSLTVILGRSGSGKSTLLNLIGGIDTPDAGSISIDGIDISNLSDYDRTLFRRRHFGFVFQFFNLIPTLNVMENTILVSELNGKTTKTRKASAVEILQQVGLADRLASYPDNLSGGEQQRVAISRALAHNPSIVLADEPTGNLDHETGNSVLDIMQRLIRQQGKTLIMATHSREALKSADHVYRIENGSLLPAVLGS